MIKRTLFSALAMIIVFICLICMMCPSLETSRLVPTGEALYYPIESIKGGNSQISSDGSVTVTGANPNIYLDNINQEITTVAINFAEPLSKSFKALMYYDTGNGLSESEKAYSSAFKGDEWVCFVIPQSLCKAVRLDINLDYKIKSVNFYTEQPVMQTNRLEHPWWKYALCSFICIGIFLAVFFLDIKFKFVNAVCNYFINKKKAILIGTLTVIASAGLSSIVEIVLGKILGASSDGNLFNVYRFVTIYGVVLTVAALILFVRSVAQKPEKLCLCLLLIWGMVMIFAAPFGHISWDVETHYFWALDSSYIGTAYQTEADSYVINNTDLYWSKQSALDNADNIKMLNDSHNFVVSEHTAQTKLSHLPSGIFIAFARFFNANFYWTYTLGKVPNLLIYALLFYFAMKKLKSGKMIVAVLAFFPTNMFLATHYSYDYWVTAFSVLGVSYFVSEMQQPQKQISLKDNIIMCSSLALACIPKLLYAPILLIPFFLRKNEFKDRKRYYTVCVLAFALLFFMLAIRSFFTVSSTGDTRGGSTVSPTGQILYMLGDPINFIKILLNFLSKYLSFSGAKDYIVNLAYMGYGSGHVIMLILFIVTAFTDKNEYDLNNKYLLTKGFNLLLLIGMAALMATAFYIDFTPVKSNYISGCQGRYLTPLLLPAMSVIGSKMINNKMNRTVYNYLILVPCCAVILSTVTSSFLSRLV